MRDDYTRALADLRANFENLDASDQAFASSMLKQSRTKTLSERQMVWVHKLAVKNAPQDLTNRAVRAADVSAPKADLFNGIRAMFDRNIAGGTKKLGIRMEFREEGGITNLRVSLASDLKRLHVAEPDVTINGEVFPGRYFGFIDKNGVFTKSAKVERNEGVIAALTELDADPMAVALEYGRKTGTCCVCGKELTNKVSVAEGIGPICSGRLA